MTTTTVHPDIGAAVRLRDLGPGEEDVLDAVFAGLSATSRYRRFHYGTPALTPAVRASLAAVDGERHLAVAAFVGDEPVGIARLIATGGGRADLAVEVVDAWQGRGVGGRLVHTVLVRGAEAGFTTVDADVLSTNGPMLGLLAGLLPDHTRRVSGPETRVSASLEGLAVNNPFAGYERAAQHRAELLAASRDRRLARLRRRPRPTRPVRTTGGDAA
ncbi:GNAT family N-acetyltransferase [Pseudonocardia xishanensis]|uniref:N-acetyltransferase domain-containing protein n=1 Tax=Pseudonocardia xishanensis TaxID=630995 RepID=A0ABP8S2K6_9PSEU